MDINFAETKAIADTLPIGLYAKRRVPVAISDTEKTSYYNPMTDEIILSYPIIAKGLEKATEEDYKETAIRSMQYHELAHAILTPNELSMPDWMNVFEDERIETLLNGYFLDVDFKKQVLAVNGFTSLAEVAKPTDGFQKYYNIVRFGIGEKKYVDKVTEIINKYARMTKAKTLGLCWDYYYDVRAFYEEIVDDFKSNPSGGSGSDGDGDGAEGSTGTMMDKVKGDKPSGKSSDKASKSGTPSKGDSTEGDGSSSKSDKESDKDGACASCDTAVGRPSPLSTEEISEIFEDAFNKNPYANASLVQKMTVIIDNFSKKNNSGSAMSAYSGVFNPRSVARRDDYKFWDKRSSVNGVNRFGTLHLNLFIDESGSFYYSEQPMNELLRALTEIESKNKNFTFDVVFCGMGERLVTDKRKRIFQAGGGNRLDHKVYDLFRQLQKPNTFNYNIACFDGDACSDGGYSDHGFGAFDNASSTIITDRSNERYISNDVHSAKVIYTKNYASELIDNVTAVLAKAFR